MFILKKLLTPFILPPAFFILLLLASAFGLWRKRQRHYAWFIFSISLAIWLLSTGPVSSALLKGLESGLTIPSPVHGDAIILLGGGIREGVPDLTGRDTPSDDMMVRLVTAVRLQRSLHLPVIVSGGSGFAGRAPEAPVIRRFLVDLGVPEDKVLLEARSRDTYENALYCRDIVQQHGFRNLLLVTSAYHMPRSILAFRKAGLPVTPVPAQFMTGDTSRRIWLDWFPSASHLYQSAVALHEYFGLLFYRLGGTTLR